MKAKKKPRPPLGDPPNPAKLWLAKDGAVACRKNDQWVWTTSPVWDETTYYPIGKIDKHDPWRSAKETFLKDGAIEVRVGSSSVWTRVTTTSWNLPPDHYRAVGEGKVTDPYAKAKAWLKRDGAVEILYGDKWFWTSVVPSWERIAKAGPVIPLNPCDPYFDLKQAFMKDGAIEELLAGGNWIRSTFVRWHLPPDAYRPVTQEKKPVDPYAKAKDWLKRDGAVECQVDDGKWESTTNPTWVLPPDAYRAVKKHPHSTVTVRSNHGTADYDCVTGWLTDSDWAAGQEQYLPTRLDVFEWRRKYPGERIVGEHDILDFGMWMQNGEYEPPEEEWRKEFRKARPAPHKASTDLDKLCLLANQYSEALTGARSIEAELIDAKFQADTLLTQLLGLTEMMQKSKG